MNSGKKQAFEPTGLIPRSIVRTFDRFYKQLLPKTKYAAIREYRISRYQVLVSLRCLCTLFFLPLATRFLVHWFVFPQVQQFWKVTYQDEHVFSEIDQYSQVLFFNSLLEPNQLAQCHALQEKMFELAETSYSHGLESVTNVFSDFSSVIVLILLILTLKPEITILKSFLIEVIYNLSDTTKSFLLILITDLLVGFHSPRGWETMFSFILYHFGLPENQDFVFLFVATLPVILDTVFKYWIFRHLNKISPSTVATYHNMIE